MCRRASSEAVKRSALESHSTNRSTIGAPRKCVGDKADALFDKWAGEETQLIAPAFFEVETDSILRQKVSLRKELTVAQAERAFASLQTLPIKTTHSPKQRERAWEIACEFQFPTVYDATYLALAELRQCEFWTADEKLFKEVKDKLTSIHWLGNYSRDKLILGLLPNLLSTFKSILFKRRTAIMKALY